MPIWMGLLERYIGLSSSSGVWGKAQPTNDVTLFGARIRAAVAATIYLKSYC